MSRPSPSFRATWPPKRPTAPEAACWYCAMRSRHSSASSCCESGVEPTRSQKSTVSWRRSPPGIAASGASVDVGAPDTGATVGSRAPHPPQNFSPGSFATPQAAQLEASAAPHSAQKRRSRRFVCPQDGQRTVPFSPTVRFRRTDPSRLVLHGSEVCQRSKVMTCFWHRPTPAKRRDRSPLPVIWSALLFVKLLRYRMTIDDHAAACDSHRKDDRGDSPGAHANGFSPLPPRASPSPPPLRKDGDGARHPLYPGSVGEEGILPM